MIYIYIYTYLAHPNPQICRYFSNIFFFSDSVFDKKTDFFKNMCFSYEGKPEFFSHFGVMTSRDPSP